MIYMNSLQDITSFHPLLPHSAIRFLEDFFEDLRGLLGQGELGEPFCLSDHGYTLILLEPMESLPNVQFAGISVPEAHAEYAERIVLEDVQLFKACLMDDNENFTFVISVAGTQVSELEKWFADHVERGQIA
ncbi:MULTISPECIES: hypothetical protein [unclassified Paenibacillus]|uniref:hypothetical protein n=1 Tax=unclassified Paenibacillus TaxID=185978 RepID=UPI001AE782DA|nr:MULTISPECIES: hypothetical protein [unclassified Paenibacillus]MBP1157684.1 hypothetical protein [Paenibacillus sp. PvP091]MBP1171579.1 hypothetical protein [Paenibacillus sp. PvR098]MBP2437960.1 hypothetical protein [Paenibacillus sp. PvP052]